MNETDALKHLLETMSKEYDDLGKALLSFDESDEKYVRIMNTRNRIAKTILATISLMRDPKRQILFDDASESKRDVAKMAKEILESEKKALTIFKDAGRSGKKTRGMAMKTAKS